MVRCYFKYWEESKALEFALSVVWNGYVLQLVDNPDRYEEPDNISFRKEMD